MSGSLLGFWLDNISLLILVLSVCYFLWFIFFFSCTFYNTSNFSFICFVLSGLRVVVLFFFWLVSFRKCEKTFSYSPEEER